MFDLSAAPAKILVCLHGEGFTLVEIADSFDEFVDCLELDPDMI